MAGAETSRFATHAGVRLHYVVAGAGPLLLFIHGVPDYWNGWRQQLAALGTGYRVAAMDLRGFNLSDKPADARAYRIAELVGDVLAVLHDLGGERATLIGHDWGAILGWWVATLYPNLLNGLAVLSAPHPLCYLAARDCGDLRYPQAFQDQILAAPAGAPFDASTLSKWVSDDGARAELSGALQRSDPESIRNYYRANLPAQRSEIPRVPPVQVPVLMMYGGEDGFIPPHYYERSARHVSAAFEIVPIPYAGHYIHQESAERVTMELVRWLGRHNDAKPNR